MSKKNDNTITSVGLEKNDFVEVMIDDMGYMGEGIAHYNGVAIFIKNAIKGEKIRAKIILVKPTFMIGIIDKLIVSSESRVTPPCPYFNKCGGCSLQHIEYKTQVEFKTASLKNTLLKQIKNLPDFEPCILSDKEYNYRNKLSLPIRQNTQTPSDIDIGFFAQNSHNIVSVDDCCLQSFDCKNLLQIIKEFAKENSLKGYNENGGAGELRHLVCREIGGKLVVAVVLTRPLKAALKALNNKLAAEYGKRYSLYANYNNINSNVIFSNSFEFIGGNNAKITYNNIRLELHPAAFFQVNNFIKDELYKRVINEVIGGKPDEINKKDIVIDAYSGAGLLSGMLSKYVNKVFALEINKDAHNAALLMAKDNNLDNIKCVLGDCAETLPKLINKLKQEESLKNNFNTAVSIIFDPPRAGLSESVISAVLQNAVDKIVYVSCNPSTLARDLKLLENGYLIQSVSPFDMFPQTPNIETLVVLKKK